ncbi:MAG: SDR family NAD(P)-dependent oxidoreductase [Cyclobacteriaceae bacterium]|nr:SDR family NAD(P)-dependent oxidoreductase [Cyclobacteriaceae bacterium]UYN87782.1 MAG: SDR family NAD(P)-dependent oxidoreductase [Cyclobacteriaceae bacterium]
MLILTKQFPHKRAFITGAASGLGKALSLHLAVDGWTIGISDVNIEALKATHHEIEQAGGKAISFQLDVSDKVAYKKVADDFLKQTGGIDLLVNNAGVGDGGKFEEYSLDNWEWMVRINQFGVIYGCHHFIPTFKKQQSGQIMNIASIAGVSCAPQMGAYNMTKAAVIAMSETLYGELMDDNIRVSCVMPSYFKTNIAKGVRGGDRIKKITQTFIERSGFQATEIAQEILVRAGKGELYIILPKAARKIWMMKRLMPTRLRRIVKEKYMQAIGRIR